MTAPKATPDSQPEVAPGFGLARVVLRPRKALPFYGRHPWVLDSAIARLEDLGGEPIADVERLDGAVVDLLSDRGKFIARGLWNSRSQIRVRLYTFSVGEALDEAFWRQMLAAALRRRQQLGYVAATHPATDAEAEPTRRTAAAAELPAHDGPPAVPAQRTSLTEQAARLVFSEGDGLSGLVVDQYGDYLVMQVSSAAIARRTPLLVSLLAEMCRPRGIVVRADRAALSLEGLASLPLDGWGELPAEPVLIREHGVQYGVDLRRGQKTGFYLDQRENRRAAAAYLGGRRVLDMFCYTGGFSLAAVRLGGARQVLGIDGSRQAIALARANAQLNGVSQAQFEVADAFATLAELNHRGERFGGVILDPPKFAASRATVNAALRAYHRLNRLAVELLEPGGILVTCSCSGHVTREDLLHVLAGVAQRTGRLIQVLEQRGAAPDHPVSASCLETEYLKCMICRVE
jgi:23S rRNA (cytosine1962-C5)-methyltransferase